MTDTPPLPPKIDVARGLLQDASLYVHLDPRGEDVVVPPQFHGQSQLVLQLGFNMAVKIPDLEVDEKGIGCTLSFNRMPHWCFLPWGSIYALVGEDGRGMIWPDDVPSEVAAENRRAGFKVVPKDSKPGERPSSLPDSVAGDATPAAQSPVSVVPDPPDEPIEPPQLAIAPQEAPKIEPVRSEDEDDDEPPPDGGKRPSYLRVVK